MRFTSLSLENLEFASSPYDESATRLLPPSLEKMLSELEDHFQKLYEWQVEAQDNQQRARDEKKHK